MRIDIRHHFDAWMRESCVLGSNTYRARDVDFRSLLEFLSDHQLVTLGHLTSSTVASWRDSLLASNYSAATVNRRLSTMREFVSWVRMRNPHLNIPSLELPEVTTPKRPPRGLTENQIEYLRQVISDLPKGLNKSRLEFCFEFLLHTGLRPNEIAGLTFSHVRGDFLMGVGGKAEHYRDVFLEDEAKSALHIWVKARRELTGTKEEKTGAVLIGRYGAKISYESLRYWFQKLGAKVDGFSMYSLRHTRAIELLERTGDLPLVADQLGHQFVETTMHYLRRSHEQIATRLRLRETPERRGEHPDEPGHRRLFGRDVADIALTLGR